MPIYAYKCASCGYSKEVLQKISDPVLTICPACGLDQYQKQITAAGFQLKGSGWYVTDFRNGGDSKSSSSPTNASNTTGTVSPSNSADSSAGKDSSSSSTSNSSTTPSTTPAPAASDKSST